MSEIIVQDCIWMLIIMTLKAKELLASKLVILSFHQAFVKLELLLNHWIQMHENIHITTNQSKTLVCTFRLYLCSSRKKYKNVLIMAFNQSKNHNFGFIRLLRGSKFWHWELFLTLHCFFFFFFKLKCKVCQFGCLMWYLQSFSHVSGSWPLWKQRCELCKAW